MLVNGRLEVLGVLGRGSHARVLLVADRLRGGERLAAKVLDPGLDSELLRWEFAQLTSLGDPSLARAHGLETVGSVSGEPLAPLEVGALLLTQDFVDGRAADLVADGLPSSEREAFAVAVAGVLCRALAYLHDHGVLHRDVKPANVIVGARPEEARLVDLALSSRSGGAVGLASGSLAFMAPEAMAGVAEPRSDLFSLGATLFRLLAGRLPFGPEADVAGTVRAVLEGRAPNLREVAAGVAPGLAGLVASLLAPEASRRPASAEAVFLELARLFGPEAVGLDGGAAGVVEGPAQLRRGPAPWQGPVLGRARELDRLADLATAALAGGSASPVVALVGRPGVGKTALVRALGQRLQLAAAAGGRPTPALLSGELHSLARALRSQAGGAAPPHPRLAAWLGEGPAPESVPSRAALCDELAAVALAAAVVRPLLLHLDAAREPLALDVAAYLAGQAGIEVGPRGGLAVFVEVAEATARLLPEAVPRLEVEPLDTASTDAVVADRLGGAPPERLLRAARVASRGLPALLEAFLVQVAARGGPEALDDRALAAIDLGAEGERALEAEVSALPEAARGVLAGLAFLGLPASASEVAALLGLDAEAATEALGRLWREGLVTVEDECLFAPRPGDRAALAEAVPGPERGALHLRAVSLLAGRGPAAASPRAVHAVAAGLGAEAGALSLAAGEALLSAGDPAGALPHLESAADLAAPEVARAAEGLLRRALVAAGRYDEAAERLRAAVRKREAGARVELARTLRLGGDLEGARVEATKAVRSRAGAAAGRALLARLALDGGDAAGALAAAGDPEPGAASDEVGADDLEESVGLAHLALGRDGRARSHFEVCHALREAAGDQASLARAENLLGMVAHHRGDWPEAARRYAEASSLAAKAGHPHAEATYAVNLASCRLETGDLGGALGPFRRAVGTLAGLGREAELGGALLNLGTLLLALSDLEGASRACARASAAAARSGARQVEAYCDLLEGDLLLRRGKPEEAARAFERGAERFRVLGASRELLLSQLSLAGARRAAGQLEAAAREVAALRPEVERARSGELVARLAVERARLALAGAGEPREALAALDAVRPALADRGGRDLLWRLDLLAASLAERLGEWDGARARLRAARQGAEEAAYPVPELYRPGLETDPDREALRRLSEALAGGDMNAREIRAEGDPAVLRRLLAINKRLNSELRLGRLLDEIIDTVVELTDAERGFLLLKEKDGRLEPRSARNIERTSLKGDDLALSRSIAERVVATGAPVVTVDAQADGRFGAAASVHALRLRSILAVPLRVRGEVVGAVYVDDRLRPGAFADEALVVVQHVADQAAIAVETARLLAENRRRQRQVEALARRLQKEVDRQRIELEELRRELDGKRAELETKYSYDKIVARSSAMASVFRVLDRVTDSEVPVVLQGESGTGKELVARAIHFNGPRRERPFVTENCGAIPETLLESALFGHVRGAFTGADRTRPGLFEVASGGTLLLDEVSEMSPAMQAKLLRVLQEGELRPVGGDRTVRVDVRVIASANRDLGELVRAGRFREDLYYRLNVITVRLPSLRERPEDIPLLVEHFLSKHGGRVRAVDRAALRRLTAYGWPGNVRQLENEVLRAAVLADEVIHEEHLSPEIREPAAEVAGRAADDLELRGHVDDLERGLIGRALLRHGGNQSKAAEALGLSRFGLQKKMKRLGIDPRAS